MSADAPPPSSRRVQRGRISGGSGALPLPEIPHVAKRSDRDDRCPLVLWSLGIGHLLVIGAWDLVILLAVSIAGAPAAMVPRSFHGGAKADHISTLPGSALS